MPLTSLKLVAHEVHEAAEAWLVRDDVGGSISSTALRIVVAAAIALVLLVGISAIVKDRVPKLKGPLFALIASTMAGSVLVLLGSTIYLNQISDSGGPVHWHADFEIWACDNQLELRDPSGVLSNKIGTPVLHEHDDRRIHLEGVVVDKQYDASLGKFMHVVGGAITENRLVVPLNDDPDRWFEDDIDGDGPNNKLTAAVTPYIFDDSDRFIAEFSTGQKCGETEAEVQVFVYHYNEDHDVYWQEKLAFPQFYTISEGPNIPPGDCLIFEFGPAREKTDRLCEQYGVRDIERCEAFGVEADKRSLCTIREVHGVSSSGEVIELDDSLPASEEEAGGA